MLDRLANILLLETIKIDLLKDLKLISKLLIIISSNLVKREINLLIFNIYERKFISELINVIVDKNSAPLLIEANYYTIYKFLLVDSK